MMNNDDDVRLHTYQDDLDTEDDDIDEAMIDENDDPAELFSIPESEAGELEKEFAKEEGDDDGGRTEINDELDDDEL